MAKRKSSKLRSLQIRRISAIIKRAEAKGYVFGEFKEQYKSFSTQKLKNLTAPQIKSQAEYIPNFTDMVLRNVEEMIQEGIMLNIRVGKEESCTTAENGRYLKEILDAEINAYGRDKVALACEAQADDIIVRARETIYASSTSKCVRRANDIKLVIRSEIPTIKQQKMDAEKEEDYDDESEYEI